MTLTRSLETKREMLNDRIKTYEKKEGDLYKRLVSNWEDSLIDCITDLDLLEINQGKVELKIELEGGRATDFEVSPIVLADIAGKINTLLNGILEYKVKDPEILKVSISNLEDCCTLMSLEIDNTKDSSKIQQTNESISYLLNSLNMIKDRNIDLDLFYLSEDSIREFESLLFILKENKFDMKLIAKTDSGFHKKTTFNLDITNQILEETKSQ